MKTGTDVVRSGLYATECCLIELELHKKGMFPRCPHCLKLTKWDFVQVEDEAA
jgi:hypothetical protein